MKINLTNVDLMPIIQQVICEQVTKLWKEENRDYFRKYIKSIVAPYVEEEIRKQLINQSITIDFSDVHERFVTKEDSNGGK